MFQADRLGPEVGGHQAPCCIHHVNQGELSHDDSTIKIVLALLLCIIIIIITCTGKNLPLHYMVSTMCRENFREFFTDYGSL